MDVNITSLRLVDPTKPKAQSIIAQWQNLVTYGFPNRTFSTHYFVDNFAALRTRGQKSPASAIDHIEQLPNNAILVRLLNKFKKTYHSLLKSGQSWEQF